MDTLEELTCLVLAAVLLAPWQLEFALDARRVYADLYEKAAAEAKAGTLGWLAAAGLGYQDIRRENVHRVRVMSLLSAVLAALLVLQTAVWLIVLALN